MLRYLLEWQYPFTKEHHFLWNYQIRKPSTLLKPPKGTSTSLYREQRPMKKEKNIFLCVFVVTTKDIQDNSELLYGLSVLS